jgi:LuxR family transcriptional regulator, maltose regulon positive regulatory protein
LRSAVLGEFSSEMCDAALGRTDSAEMIGEILRNNLLLSPIDAEHRWYRYHPLFADFLRARMEREARLELPALHRRAAAWSAERGLTDEAVSHALAANDYEFAADLLTTTAMDKVRSGRVADTARGVEALPEAVVLGRPALLRAAAFAAIFAHRYDAARRYMNAIERSEDAARGAEDDIAAMRLMLFGWTDRVTDLLQAVQSLRKEASRFGPFTRGLASNASAFCNIALGRFLEAERDLAETREACEPINALYVLSYAACFSAAIELNHGQAAAARATLAGALDRAIAEGQRYGSSGAVVAPI